MGYITEHRGRRPKVFVPGTGQFLYSTCIRTNQSNKGIRYSAILTERTRRQCQNKSSDHNQMHFNINIKSDRTKVKKCRRDFGKGNYKEIRKSLAFIDWERIKIMRLTKLTKCSDKLQKSKRNFEHKLAQNIKSDSKNFYAYVRSKQNVQDKVGPLEDNFGNMVTEGFLMAKELNMHFSSVGRY